jgi:hypothetical protein
VATASHCLSDSLVRHMLGDLIQVGYEPAEICQSWATRTEGIGVHTRPGEWLDNPGAAAGSNGVARLEQARSPPVAAVPQRRRGVFVDVPRAPSPGPGESGNGASQVRGDEADLVGRPPQVARQLAGGRTYLRHRDHTSG